MPDIFNSEKLQDHGRDSKSWQPRIETRTISSDVSPLDPVKEKALLRKLDWHVLPMITVLYMFAFVDRINIGNARIQGMETDLGMKGNDLNVALFIFFVPYILCEVPSNMILKRIKPSTWLSFLMFGWGEPKSCYSDITLIMHQVC